MSTLTYRVEARARRLPVGWDLELSSGGSRGRGANGGHVIHVESLDNAAEAVLHYLDQRGSPIGHAHVEVAIVHPAVGDTPPHTPRPAVASHRDPVREPETTGLEMTLRLLSARDATDTFGDAAQQVFPWITKLPGSQIPQCRAQLLIALNTAVQHSRYGDLEDAVHRWQTAAGTAGHPEQGPEGSTGSARSSDSADSGSGSGSADQGSSADRTGRHFLSEYPSAARRSTPTPAQRPTKSSRTGRHRL